MAKNTRRPLINRGANEGENIVKPYYEHAGITIYHGDCREILPTLPKVDLVLTDPPYGICGPKGSKNKQRGKTNYNTDLFDDTPEYVRDCVVPIVNEAITISQRMILTPGSKCMFMYPEPEQMGVFWMPSGMGLGKWGWINCQPIFYYGKDPRIGKTIDQTSKVMNGPASSKLHPCAKPIKAWKWLLYRGSLKDELVLDPFMGSGTTLVAAKELGRKAIGIEIEEKYCEIAAKRLAQEVLF